MQEEFHLHLQYNIVCTQVSQFLKCLIETMEYQMLTYFAKMTFLSSLFPQYVISYFPRSLCRNASLPSPCCQIINFTLQMLLLPTPHPIANCTLPNHQLCIPLPIAHCQITNSTLANCQLDIVSATLPTCQVDFIFQAAPMFFKLPPTPPPPKFTSLLNV